jgi:hypothetical protein
MEFSLQAVRLAFFDKNRSSLPESERNTTAYALITAVNIAIRTSGTYLVTTVPRIPNNHNSPLLSNAASSPFYYSIQISRIQAFYRSLNNEKREWSIELHSRF